MSEISDDQKQILLEAIENFNDTLVTQSINLSGQAFSNALRLGCSLVLIPLIIALAVTYFVRGLDFSVFYVYGCAAGAIAIVFASLVSNRAKYLAVQEKYQQDVNPDIVRFLAEHEFTRAQFDSLADDVLADNAPLREYLVIASTEKGEKEANDDE